MLSINQSLSIVVPTLWKVSSFPERITSLANSDVISQIIVIDNDPVHSFRLSHPKINVLSKGGNIFVNPAWNLGVKFVVSRFTCLLNDDIEATPELLEYVVSILNNDNSKSIGLIGLAEDIDEKVLGYRVATLRNEGFGEAMFFHTKNYFPIPNHLKIWCGDDYLFLRSELEGRIILEVTGLVRSDSMKSSSTINSNRVSFTPILKRDLNLWHGFYKKMLLLRYRPISTISESLRYRISKIFPPRLVP